jgi:hypothetical protein
MSSQPTPPDTDTVKLCCGHRVPRASAKLDSETGWCPTCKRRLFTGWPEHMTEKAKTAERLKGAVVGYLDFCIDNGEEATMARLVGLCEPILRSVAFSHGYESGGAVDGD